MICYHRNMSNRDAALEVGLAGIYSQSHLQEDLDYLREKHPDKTEEELLQLHEQEPTCKHSFFGREGNLRVISEFMAGEPQRYWSILSAGCGNGPEPFEIALRLEAQGVKRFNISGFDTSPRAIEQAQSGHIEYLAD
jgi:chemotaxis methyl-accepting protein methylase